MPISKAKNRGNINKKRKRHRKSRTQDISSTSSSSDESASQRGTHSTNNIQRSSTAEREQKSAIQEPKSSSTAPVQQRFLQPKQTSQLLDSSSSASLEPGPSIPAGVAAKSIAELPTAPLATTATHSQASKPLTPFESWYLRRLATEFAPELDALRQAPDFRDESIAVLREALRAGADLWEESEKRFVLGSGNDAG